MTVKECFVRDYELCKNFVLNDTFYEGVRCVLVNKGDSPNWKYKNVLEVPEAEVEKFFANKARGDYVLNI